MKYLVIIYLVTLCFHYVAQDVKSKDGVSLGKRNDFIAACTKGADAELMKIDGIEVETFKYCACICDNVIPTIDFWELDKAIKENTIVDLFVSGENRITLMKCFEGNFKINSDYKFEASNNKEKNYVSGVTNCVKEIMNNPENIDIWTTRLAEEYCDCAMNKLFSSGYTYKDFLELDDENGESYNEIIMPCVTKTLKHKSGFKSSNTYNLDDIKGGGYSSSVPLIDYLGQGYKLKISISGINKYYLLDTGASDLIIDRDTERELLLEGVLKKENYLGKTEYSLANNDKVLAQEVKINNITIGDYTLNNVLAAIIDEGSLLCGKSFLDKFKKWEIDKQNNVLILYK